MAHVRVCVSTLSKEGGDVAGEASLVTFCEIQGEEGVQDCVFIEGDLPHLRDVGVTRRLLHAARETLDNMTCEHVSKRRFMSTFLICKKVCGDVLVRSHILLMT